MTDRTIYDAAGGGHPVMESASVVIAAAQREPLLHQELHIKPVGLTPFADDGLYFIENMDGLEGSILTLAAFGDGQCAIYGSAALVAPGIAIAAAHVIAEHDGDGLFEAVDAALYAFGVSATGLAAWQVLKITYSLDGDLAVLTLAHACEPRSPVDVAHFLLSAKLPRVGDRVTAVGFRPRNARQALEPEIQVLPDVAGTFLLSSGAILEVWPQGRDRVMAPRPCFAAALATVGAMSGGPVLDADGKMIGIVTSSDESATAPYTMVTLIWDALLKPVSPAWPPGYWPPGGGLLSDLLDPEEGWRLRKSTEDEFRYEFDPSAAKPKA
ncbi:serine protease [Sphingopyxis sp. SE2]|jgi:hypothetical protein|uniref:S1 family peptidase n=1 Tax=Sphingomonadales TaxID=204457 RepID=UPI000F87289A|nr:MULTISPECIES: serine protease [Sphingomonadaceae]MDT7531593.1 serine protease [Sphingopyxis sp. SE2]RUN74930.1 serine protease [Sphingomonas sp. TF3]